MILTDERAQELLLRWNRQFPPATPVQYQDGETVIITQTVGEPWACRAGAGEEWQLKILIRHEESPVDLTRLRPYRRPTIDHPDLVPVVKRVRELIASDAMMTITLRVDIVIGLLDQLNIASCHPLCTDQSQHAGQVVHDTLLDALPEDVAGFMRSVRGLPAVSCEPIDWMEEGEEVIE